MEAAYWHQRWETSQIGFHQLDVHPMLVAHFGALGLPEGSRIFVPLCGKTLDIPWLLSQGYRVVGIDLSEIAIAALFESLDLAPSMTENGDLKHFHAPGLDVFVGDIFALDAPTLGAVDAVYDRAALIALPEDMRKRYANHVPAITNNAPQLLISFDYDPTLMEGPPFSIGAAQVESLYGSTFEITAQASAPVDGGLQNGVPAEERVWVLR